MKKPARNSGLTLVADNIDEVDDDVDEFDDKDVENDEGAGNTFGEESLLCSESQIVLTSSSRNVFRSY